MRLPALFLAATSALCLHAETITVKPADAVIVVPAKIDAIVKVAAAELQQHVEMLTGVKMPVVAAPVTGKYSFIFGTPAGVTLAPEEARWEVTADATRLYGDSVRVKYTDDSKIWSDSEKGGDLTAVYDFLEKQLGFLFLAPGPSGTAFEPTDALRLQTGKASWTPGNLTNRMMRPVCSAWLADSYVKNNTTPAPFKLTKDEYLARNKECLVWLKKQRMGQSLKHKFGHAFCYWWGIYGKEHPEYFALFKGKRAPERPNRPDTIKMCPSNKAFHEEIVKNWLANPRHNEFINVCENDWGDYCECDECRKLDTPPPQGLKWNEYLSDRYVYMANSVLEIARKKVPNAKVCMYAYATYTLPPTRERVADGVYIGFVPSMFQLEKVDAMYKGWRAMGAKQMYQRPNDHHCNTGLPMGFEKTLFDHFQVGIANNIYGTDYDSLHGFWETTGVADYILARGHIDPSKSFDYWMDEYCSAYGNAAGDVKAFYAYWRQNIWEKRLLPNRKRILDEGKYGNFRGGLMQLLKNFYFTEDFDKTDAIIDAGLAKTLTANQRKRLETLKLANKHSRMTFDAIIAEGDAKKLAAGKLFQFRKANRDKLNMQWDRLFSIEEKCGDIAGTGLISTIGDYLVAKGLPTWFYFMPDKDNVGDKEHWEQTPFAAYSQTWHPLSIERSWEKQPFYPTEELEILMRNYNGIGYYGQKFRIPASWKGQEIALRFGAVDESAWIYVNGRLCGEHIYKDENDWQTPFTIRIDNAIDWDKDEQSVVVKVRDVAGLGGIWKLVSLVMR